MADEEMTNGICVYEIFFVGLWNLFICAQLYIVLLVTIDSVIFSNISEIHISNLVHTTFRAKRNVAYNMLSAISHCALTGMDGYGLTAS